MKRVNKKDPVNGRTIYTRMQDEDKQRVLEMVSEIQKQSSIVVLIPWDDHCRTGASMSLQPRRVTWSDDERLLVISDDELHSLQMTVIGLKRSDNGYWTIHCMMHDVHILAEV